MNRFYRLGGAAAVAVAIALGAIHVSPLAKGSAPAAPKLPATIQGLAVKPENVEGTLKQDSRPLYTDSIWLYSLRQGKELMATLEIGHFKSDAPWRSADFDLSLADQLGGSVPAVVRLDGVAVYISTTRGLELTAWFEGGYMYILGVRNTYTQPKLLLRQILGLRA